MSAKEFFRKVIGIEIDENAPGYKPGRRNTLDLSHNVILYLKTSRSASTASRR